jgi:hypothetical protein
VIGHGVGGPVASSQPPLLDSVMARVEGVCWGNGQHLCGQSIGVGGCIVACGIVAIHTVCSMCVRQQQGPMCCVGGACWALFLGLRHAHRSSNPASIEDSRQGREVVRCCDVTCRRLAISKLPGTRAGPARHHVPCNTVSGMKVPLPRLRVNRKCVMPMAGTVCCIVLRDTVTRPMHAQEGAMATSCCACIGPQSSCERCLDKACLVS